MVTNIPIVECCDLTNKIFEVSKRSMAMRKVNPAKTEIYFVSTKMLRDKITQSVNFQTLITSLTSIYWAKHKTSKSSPHS